MQGRPNDGKRFSYPGSQPAAPEQKLPPLTQEVLDVAHIALKPLEALFPKKEIREQHQLQEIEAAIALSHRPEIVAMSREGTLFAFFRFFSTDPNCVWLANYRRFCKEHNKRPAVRIKLLTDNDFCVLYQVMKEFYAGFATHEEPPIPSDFPSRKKTRPVKQAKVPIQLPPVEDRMRTEEEWLRLKEEIGDVAGVVDPIISGRKGQDSRWTNAVYLELLDLRRQCSPRFLQTAQGTWGLIAEWNGARYEITDEYERIAFLNRVSKEIWEEKRKVEKEQDGRAFAEWQKTMEEREEIVKQRLTAMEEKANYGKSPH